MSATATEIIEKNKIINALVAALDYALNEANDYCWEHSGTQIDNKEFENAKKVMEFARMSAATQTTSGDAQ